MFRCWFPLELTGWFTCRTRDSQESSSAPQFKSINSSALSLLYGPTISLHDYWKTHSFDYTNLCWQSDVSAFQYAVYVCHRFPSKEQASFNFMAQSLDYINRMALSYLISLVAQSVESACNTRDLGSILGSGRVPGERNGNPLKYSCLENSMDREA